MATATKNETEEKETTTETQDGPLLDLSDDAVKKMIKAAKKRGYVTVDELNSVLPSDEVSSEQIEDTMAMLSDMGSNVVDEDEVEEEQSTELATSSEKALAQAKKREPADRTDDPVRMYLREMGTVELLSREGEIAIAKRIEAGRDMMIGGICESPLTIQAIVRWHDALVNEEILLRELVDLDATMGGGPGQPRPPDLLHARVGGGVRSAVAARTQSHAHPRRHTGEAAAAPAGAGCEQQRVRLVRERAQAPA